MTFVCSNVTQFLVLVGAQQCRDTEQLKTPKLGSLWGTLHRGKQPGCRRAERGGSVATHVRATHVRAHESR